MEPNISICRLLPLGSVEGKNRHCCAGEEMRIRFDLQNGQLRHNYSMDQDWYHEPALNSTKKGAARIGFSEILLQAQKGASRS